MFSRSLTWDGSKLSVSFQARASEQLRANTTACWNQTWTFSKTDKHPDTHMPTHTRQPTLEGVRDTTAVPLFWGGNHNGGALQGRRREAAPASAASLPPASLLTHRTRPARRWKACVPPVGSRLFSPLSCLICILFDLLLLIWAPSPLKADVCKQCLFSSRRGLEDDGFWVINPQRTDG